MKINYLNKLAALLEIDILLKQEPVFFPLVSQNSFSKLQGSGGAGQKDVAWKLPHTSDNKMLSVISTLVSS